MRLEWRLDDGIKASPCPLFWKLTIKPCVVHPDLVYLVLETRTRWSDCPGQLNTQCNLCDDYVLPSNFTKKSFYYQAINSALLMKDGKYFLLKKSSSLPLILYFDIFNIFSVHNLFHLIPLFHSLLSLSLCLSFSSTLVYSLNYSQTSLSGHFILVEAGLFFATPKWNAIIKTRRGNWF